MPKQTTLIWKYFKRFKVNGNIKGECIFCKQIYANNATRMKKHLKKQCKKCSPHVRKLFLHKEETKESCVNVSKVKKIEPETDCCNL